MNNWKELGKISNDIIHAPSVIEDDHRHEIVPHALCGKAMIVLDNVSQFKEQNEYEQVPQVIATSLKVTCPDCAKIINHCLRLSNNDIGVIGDPEKMKFLEEYFMDGVKMIRRFATQYTEWLPNMRFDSRGGVDFGNYLSPALSEEEKAIILRLEKGFSLARDFKDETAMSDFMDADDDEARIKAHEIMCCTISLVDAIEAIIDYPEEGHTGWMCSRIDMNKAEDVILFCKSTSRFEFKPKVRHRVGLMPRYFLRPEIQKMCEDSFTRMCLRTKYMIEQTCPSKAVTQP